MMLVLNLLVMIVVVGVIGLTAYFLTVLGLMCFGVRRKWTFALLSVPGVVLLIVGWILYLNRPSGVFEQSFGFAPPNDVSGLQSSNFSLGDQGSTFLHFKASQATINRIIARGLSPVTSSTPSFSTNVSPPSWWTPPSTATEYRGEFSNSFASEVETLYYDPTTGQAYFRFIGVD